MNASDKLLAALARITGTGNFHASGTEPFFLPGIHVEGVGELAFPLSPGQVAELRAQAEAAPYGLGEETVLDEKVRKCWQIDAGRIEFRSPVWPEFLNGIAARIRGSLGIGGRISLHPYKLLLYGKGGHFRAHRDTEKLGAMIGSLIVALPSKHEGGRLLIRHDGREEAVDFDDAAHGREFQFAAFFADCEHEVQPVRSGWRCCLAFHIRLDRGDPGRLNLPETEQTRALLPEVAAVTKERAGDLTAVLLEHHYTEANLSWRNLKGNDPAKARALASAAREAGCAAHLALVTFHQTGQLDGDYGYSRYNRSAKDDPEDGTMGEVIEEGLSIEGWRDGKDRPVPLGCYQVAPDALLSREKIDAADPDEKESEGYTGNAGCTIDYWYRRAALVLWRVEDDERIRARYDLDGACGRLAELARDRGSQGGAEAFERLAEAIIDRYPEALPYLGPRHGRVMESSFTIALAALAAAGAREHFDRLAERVPVEAFHLCDTALWKKLSKAFGVEACAELVERTQEDGTGAHRRMLFDLLDAVRTRKDAASLARGIAERLVVLDPKERPGPGWHQSAEPVPPGGPEETRILLATSHLLAGEASRQAPSAFLRADRSLLYVRERLSPVLLDKSLNAPAEKPNSLIPEIRVFALDILETEIARPLEPYPDWTRPFPESPRGASPLIRELAKFVGDPEVNSHTFKRNQGDRSAVESFIRTHRLDLDCVTVEKSRPYSLVCTKNDASHRRRTAWRNREIELAGKLARA